MWQTSKTFLLTTNPTLLTTGNKLPVFKWDALLNEPEKLNKKSRAPQSYFARESRLINFFLSLNVDVPVHLKKHKYFYTIPFGGRHDKFLNILMDGGKKEKNLRYVLTSFKKFVHLNSTLPYFKLYPFSWLYQYPLISENVLNIKNELSMPVKSLSTILPYNYGLFRQDYPSQSVLTHSQNFSILDIILSTVLKKFTPAFSFYVQKVDKNIFKYSRGKTGKYSLIWKYVPSFSRVNVVFHWLTRDIKLQKAHTYEKRILKALDLIFFKPSSSLTSKLRYFVHRFVFQKYKKQLLSSLNVKG